MKKILILLFILLIGCNEIDKGIVVGKRYEPTQTYTTIIPLVISTGKSVTTIMIPYVITDNEDYILKVKDNEIVREVYVSKQCYEKLDTGDVWIKDSDCSFSDNNNTKIRKDD